MSEFDIAGAPVTYTLIILNLLISGYAFFVNQNLINNYALHVGSILHNKQYYRGISCGFLHADPFHFLFNMFTLFSFGRIIEAKILGSVNFALLYMGSMFISHAIAVYANRKNMNYSAIGASGAVSGIVFSFCLFAPFAPLRILFIPIDIPALVFALLYTAYSMYAMGNMQDRIAHEAHLGGALGGIIITILLKPVALEIFMRQIS